MANKPMDYAIDELRPYGILVSGHYVESCPYVIHRPSGSIDWLLMYTHSGEGEIWVNGERILCREGDVTILLPGIPHHYGANGENWSFTWVHYIPDPDWVHRLRFPERMVRFIHISLLEAELQRAFFEALERMRKYGEQGISELPRRLAMLALEEALLLLQMSIPPAKQDQIDPRIAEVLAQLQESYTEKLTLPELARQSCLSISRLSHLFKEQTGDSIGNTINKLRLEKAAELLIYTKRQIAEISEDVGYESSDHFTRMFQSHFDITPARYRKQKLTQPL
ncbi:helix-turn-helix domain-containing protein [Paenibacillus sp. 19GGS1-52]|uniref:helix-turn-helix domain-containing protein n=1 Tax=Paenibacillus sp. 19GGS1-52 TaxID=2758563 RepID=UPI001EFBD371|nr:helix-turn-helix domain-containing protein [Paenibacillus sp. 19GGS1-52]ULO09808.1 helix-turn-helix domain-containing protein [Paenibacillus sp. 19GGS1-52]